jgi:hypothetical protein
MRAGVLVRGSFEDWTSCLSFAWVGTHYYELRKCMIGGGFFLARW